MPRPPREITVAFVLLWSALTVQFACTRGLTSWEIIDWFALSYLALGMGLGVWSLVLSGSEQPAPEGRTKSPRWTVVALAVMLLGHGMFAAHKLHRVNPEQIDCYTWQRDSVKALLSGHNPYGGTQPNIYSPRDTARFYGKGIVVNGLVQVGFPYPPVSLYGAMLGYALGDVRWTFVISVLITGWLFFVLSGGVRGFFLAALVLLNPFTFYVESNCWTEPLTVMLLALAMYGAARRRWWLPIAVGLFLVSKQFGLLAVPFGIFLVQARDVRAAVRLMAKALAVSVLTLLPFLIWSTKGLFHDLVLFHLRQSFREDALSFAVPMHAMQLVGPLLLLSMIVWVVRRGMASSGMFAAAFGVGLLLFVATSKQAAPNYYYLIINAMLCGVAALPGSPLFGPRPRAAEADMRNS